MSKAFLEVFAGLKLPTQVGRQFEDVEVLKEQGIVFKTEHATIKDTGRTVSSFPDPNGIMWQLTD